MLSAGVREWSFVFVLRHPCDVLGLGWGALLAGQTVERPIDSCWCWWRRVQC